MRVVITGRPGSGKTTTVIEILKKLKGAGFYTKEIRSGRARAGFIAVTSWNAEVILAKVGAKTDRRVGKYGVFVKEFEERVVEPLWKFLKTSSFIYIDEAGKMELFSKKFRDFIEDLLKTEKDLIITVPLKDFDPLVSKIKRRADILIDAFEYWNKREEIVSKIVNSLRRRERF